MKIQQNIKNHMLRWAVPFLLVPFLLLSVLIHPGQASTSHQTIPTAPPTTAVIPIITSTDTPMNTPSTTVTSTQATHVLVSQIPSFTTSPTVKVIISSPNKVPPTTEKPGNGTIPGLTGTLSPIKETPFSPTSTQLPAGTDSSTTERPGSSGILSYLIGGGVVFIIIFGSLSWLKSRRK